VHDLPTLLLGNMETISKETGESFQLYPHNFTACKINRETFALTIGTDLVSVRYPNSGILNRARENL